MTTLTHCLTTGALAAHELSVPTVSDGVTTRYAASGGLARGVVIIVPGMTAENVTFPPTVVDVGGILPTKFATFSNDLAAEGWHVVHVVTPGYFVWPTTMKDAVYDDVSNDSSEHGGRHLRTTLHWWDHVIAYVNATYGATIPKVGFGMSWGGWHMLQIAKNAPTTVAAVGAHEFVVRMSQISTALTTPLDFSTIDTTGVDAPTTALNAFLGKPVYLSWHPDGTLINETDCANVNSAASGAGVSLTTQNSGTGDHAFNATDETNAMSWFTGMRTTFPRSF